MVSRVQLDLATKRSPTHSNVPSLDLWLHLGAADMARLRLEIFPHVLGWGCVGVQFLKVIDHL